MKADILEQVVEEYMQHRGYFTMHNVRFRPARTHLDWEEKKDDVTSDVDVLGVNPLKQGSDRVWVVSCKAWQSGFNSESKLEALEKSVPSTLATAHARKGRAMWKYFRELSIPKWSEAFRSKILEVTGQHEFSYFIAVTRLVGDPKAWGHSKLVAKNLGNNPFAFLTMETMWNEVLNNQSTTPSATSIGRLAQLLKAARVTGNAKRK